MVDVPVIHSKKTVKVLYTRLGWLAVSDNHGRSIILQKHEVDSLGGLSSSLLSLFYVLNENYEKSDHIHVLYYMDGSDMCLGDQQNAVSHNANIVFKHLTTANFKNRSNIYDLKELMCSLLAMETKLLSEYAQDKRYMVEYIFSYIHFVFPRALARYRTLLKRPYMENNDPNRPFEKHVFTCPREISGLCSDSEHIDESLFIEESPLVYSHLMFSEYRHIANSVPDNDKVNAYKKSINDIIREQYEEQKKQEESREEKKRKEQQSQIVVCATDASRSRNGKTAYGFVLDGNSRQLLLSPKQRKKYGNKFFCAHHGITPSASVGELYGILLAYAWIRERNKYCKIVFETDSKTCVTAFNSKHLPFSNYDFSNKRRENIQRLFDEVKEGICVIKKVPAHSNHALNNRADRVVLAFRRGMSVMNHNDLVKHVMFALENLEIEEIESKQQSN